jgi:hypothetical protein
MFHRSHADLHELHNLCQIWPGLKHSYCLGPELCLPILLFCHCRRRQSVDAALCTTASTCVYNVLRCNPEVKYILKTGFINLKYTSLDLTESIYCMMKENFQCGIHFETHYTVYCMLPTWFLSWRSNLQLRRSMYHLSEQPLALACSCCVVPVHFWTCYSSVSSFSPCAPECPRLLL